MKLVNPTGAIGPKADIHPKEATTLDGTDRKIAKILVRRGCPLRGARGAHCARARSDHRARDDRVVRDRETRKREFGL